MSLLNGTGGRTKLVIYHKNALSPIGTGQLKAAPVFENKLATLNRLSGFGAQFLFQKGVCSSEDGHFRSFNRCTRIPHDTARTLTTMQIARKKERGYVIRN